MIAQQMALIAAGLVGAGTALIHGILVQKFMIVPVDRRLKSEVIVSNPLRLLVVSLLQYSTFSWLAGGLALISAALFLGTEARLAVSWVVSLGYAYGVIANASATHGRHPGWMLLSLSIGLIIAGNLGGA